MKAWLAGALIAASVTATAAGPVPVTIPSRDRDPATGAPLQLGALLFLPPATPGVRVPAVVALHGCGGPDGDRRHLDVPGGVHPGQGVTVASHPAARDDSYARVRAFLRAELRAAAGARSQEE